MKKFLVLFLICPLLFLCAFKKRTNAYIMLSSANIPAVSENIRFERNFLAGQKINYAVVCPDGFKNSAVRLQVSKQDDKTSNWGFSIIQSKDLYVDKSQNFYKNYLYLYRPGKYILQFFYINNKDYPFAHTEFRVN